MNGAVGVDARGMTEVMESAVEVDADADAAIEEGIGDVDVDGAEDVAIKDGAKEGILIPIMAKETYPTQFPLAAYPSHSLPNQ